MSPAVALRTERRARRAVAAALDDARLWDLAAFHLHCLGEPQAADEATAEAVTQRAYVASLAPAGTPRGH